MRTNFKELVQELNSVKPDWVEIGEDHPTKWYQIRNISVKNESPRFKVPDKIASIIFDVRADLMQKEFGDFFIRIGSLHPEDKFEFIVSTLRVDGIYEEFCFAAFLREKAQRLFFCTPNSSFGNSIFQWDCDEFQNFNFTEENILQQ